MERLGQLGLARSDCRSDEPDFVSACELKRGLTVPGKPIGPEQVIRQVQLDAAARLAQVFCWSHFGASTGR